MAGMALNTHEMSDEVGQLAMGSGNLTSSPLGSLVFSLFSILLKNIHTESALSESNPYHVPVLGGEVEAAVKSLVWLGLLVYDDICG